MSPADIEALATGALVAAGVLGALGASLAVLGVDHRPQMVAAALRSVARVVLGIAVIVGPVVAVRFGSVLSYSLLDLRCDPLSGVFLVALGMRPGPPLRGCPVTRRYPDEEAVLAPALRGLPELEASRCDSPGAMPIDRGSAAFCRSTCSWRAARPGRRR